MPEFAVQALDDVDCEAVVLVEGESDRATLAELARRRGLALNGVAILAMGGATNLGHYLAVYGPAGMDLRLAGLCDAGEVPFFRHSLTQAGLGTELSAAAMAELGFHVCDQDLEDELIRALGTDVVERLIEDEGELSQLQTLRRQPAQRGRSAHDQLHRFMGARSGRKLHYARLMGSALDLDRVPRALTDVLDHVTR
jgi:hypothetical protein